MKKIIPVAAAILSLALPLTAAAQGYEGLIAPEAPTSSSRGRAQEAPAVSPYISPSPSAPNALTQQDMQKVLDSLPQKLALEKLNNGDDGTAKAEMDFRSLVEAARAEQGDAYKGPSPEEAAKMSAQRARLAKSRLESDTKIRKFQESLVKQRERKAALKR